MAGGARGPSQHRAQGRPGAGAHAPLCEEAGARKTRGARQGPSGTPPAVGSQAGTKPRQPGPRLPEKRATWVLPSHPALPAGIKAPTAGFSPGSGHRRMAGSSGRRDQLWAQGSLGEATQRRPRPAGLVAGRLPSRKAGCPSRPPPRTPTPKPGDGPAPGQHRGGRQPPRGRGPEGHRPGIPRPAPPQVLGSRPRQSAAPQSGRPPREAGALAARVWKPPEGPVPGALPAAHPRLSGLTRVPPAAAPGPGPAHLFREGGDSAVRTRRRQPGWAQGLVVLPNPHWSTGQGRHPEWGAHRERTAKTPRPTPPTDPRKPEERPSARTSGWRRGEGAQCCSRTHPPRAWPLARSSGDSSQNPGLFEVTSWQEAPRAAPL